MPAGGPGPVAAGPGGAVRAITVLYDANCPVCRRAKRWVAAQTPLVDIKFIAAGTAIAHERFPRLDHRRTLADITVIDDRGGVYRDDDAWVVVLWACASTRVAANDVVFGTKRTAFRSVKGATEFARSVTATAPTPPPPVVTTQPPPPVVARPSDPQPPPPVTGPLPPRRDWYPPGCDADCSPHRG